jgi:hypothetical protein
MIKRLFICLLTASSLYACTEAFDIKTDDSPPVIVIYGGLTNEETYHSVRISSSSPYFDKQSNQGVSGAEVWIESSGHDVYVFQENEADPGLYQTIEKVAGIPGQSYTLHVTADFNREGTKKPYTAASYMQSPVKIDSIDVRPVEMMGQKRYAVYLYAQDSPSKDYYLSLYKINGTIVRDKLSQLSPMDDRTFNGQYMNDMFLSMFRDAEAPGENDDDDDDERKQIVLTHGDELTLSLGHIEEGYYKFINQCRSEMQGKSPFFDTPASNIITNISGGGVGYFTCYPVTTLTHTVK